MERRSLLAAAAGGVAALSAMSSLGDAAESTGAGSRKKANVGVVNSFLRLFLDPASTAEAITALMTEDCVITISGTGKPSTVGRPAVTALIETWLKDGVRYEARVLETFSRGPLVVNMRMDRILRPNKPESPNPWIGVFVLKDGKIRDWTEVPNQS